MAICFAEVLGDGLHFLRGERWPAGLSVQRMKRNFILLGLGVCALLLGPRRADAGDLSLPPGTDAILGNTFILANGSGDSGGAGAGTRAAGASAGIFAGSRGAVVADLVPFGDYKYGMSLPRHRGKATGDQSTWM